MAFEYVLANLLAQNDGAVGVLFLDDTGETVDFACSDFSPYQMRVVGAYVGIYLRQTEKFLASTDLGSPQFLHVEKDNLHLYTMPLPDGYYLVLVQRRPALTAKARRTMEDACSQLQSELFARS
ncbi:MAG: hypothetical protein AB7G12_10840 [Thermoanaerobaculia bacterium]